MLRKDSLGEGISFHAKKGEKIQEFPGRAELRLAKFQKKAVLSELNCCGYHKGDWARHNPLQAGCCFMANFPSIAGQLLSPGLAGAMSPIPIIRIMCPV